MAIKVWLRWEDAEGPKSLYLRHYIWLWSQEGTKKPPNRWEELQAESIPAAVAQLQYMWEEQIMSPWADPTMWLYVHERGASVAAPNKKAASRLCWHVDYHEGQDVSPWNVHPINKRKDT